MRFRHVLRIAAIAVCFLSPGAAFAKPLRVVASFSILADVVKQIGGSDFDVQPLVGADSDPHRPELTPAHLKALRAADLVFMSGAGLDDWIAGLATSAGYRGPIIDASKGIVLLRRDAASTSRADPHVWTSVSNVKVWTDNIARALIDADASSATAVTDNAARYRSALDMLDRDARQRIGAIPEARRNVLIGHDVFAYFARDYAVRFLAPSGPVNGGEASAREIARLIADVKREKISRYLILNSSDSGLVRQVAAAAGAQPGGVVYGEALSAFNGEAPTYLSMFRCNLERIASAIESPN